MPYFGDEEIENLRLTIERKWVTEGPFSKEFLNIIKEKTGALHAVLANNGTLALYMALKALDLKEGDEVVVPDFTFSASAFAVIFAGGTPVFADVSRNTFNVEAQYIEPVLTKKTKVIMPVHAYGLSADLDPIMELAETNGIKVLEDAAQGYGVYYKGKATGTIGNIGTMSFFADKTITTGEGGLVMTNDEDIYNTLLHLRNQGRNSSGSFIHPELGMNFRMTDLQCAVGVAQLKKFDEILALKLKHFETYVSLLKELEEVTFVEVNDYTTFVPFRFSIIAERADELLQCMEQNEIQTRAFWYPLHKQPAFKFLNARDSKSFSNTDFISENGIMLPIFPALTSDQINYVCDTIKDFYKN